MRLARPTDSRECTAEKFEISSENQRRVQFLLLIDECSTEKNRAHRTRSNYDLRLRSDNCARRAPLTNFGLNLAEISPKNPVHLTNRLEMQRRRTDEDVGIIVTVK